jgi:eukaryotic-like serine/threonine-protein kinase
MDADRWDRMQDLFHRALRLPPSKRAEFVQGECGADDALAADVLAMLDHDGRPTASLQPSLDQAASDVLDGSVPMVRVAGPYRILRILGRGGMGVVYLAERSDLNSRVALKVLRDAALSPARRRRFEREEQTLAQLHHPSIATLYDAGVLPDGTPYFAMEYVDGVALTDYCRAHDCSLTERLRLFGEVCEAVQYAHRQAVVHRDLKPSNILVTDDGADGRAAVRLLDFGIAKPLEELESAAHTRTQLRFMTPAYAAPEQLRGEAVGVHTDVYALGVILYELLTGTLPFDLTGLTPGQVEACILEAEPEAPSLRARAPRAGGAASPAPLSLPRRTWADLDVLCLTAMHKDPQRRYPTVEALLRDLRHFNAGEPLEARPDTLGYRAGKFVRRNGRQVMAAGLAVLAFGALAGFHTGQLREQRDRAQVEAEKAERISEYLIGLFEAGDPYAAESQHPDVRGLLERGEARAEELRTQPAVQATLLNVLGRVYTQLSEFDRAEPLLDRALDLRRGLGAPLDIAESLASLASLYVDTGDYDAAETALRESLALRERHLPPNHSTLATTLASLGSVHSYQGRYQEAEALHRLALRMRRANHAGPHEDIGSSLNSLAVALFQQGDYAAAEVHYSEALAVKRAVFGPEHASLTRILANLGKLYEELGRFADADSLLTEALRIRRATLGDDHFETAIGLGQLAVVRNFMGDHEGAERHLRESLAIRERILAPNHPSIGTTLNNLASTLEHRGRYAEAEALYRRAADIYRESLGERHRFTAIALANVAQVSYRQGELDEARAMFGEALSILEEVHPEGHQEVSHNRSRLGAVLVGMERFADAEALLLEAHQALESQLGPEHPRTRQAAERIIELYEAWGMPEDAAPYRQVLALEGERAS